MDLTFQVPVQYYSLQHRTLLSPPDTSTMERHFHFGPIALFFLELLVIALCSSPVVLLDTFRPGWGAHLLVSYLSAFLYCSWGSRGKNTGVVCHSLL